MNFDHVKILPYVGGEYSRSNRFGLSILILGESHYSNNGSPLNREFTQEVVQEVIDGANYPFFTKTVGVFHGAWPNHGLRRQFWTSVVFYNFIQETVGPRPRIRPTDAMWRAAGPALEEVLIQYEPGFVLVLGKQLWENLPIPLKPGPTVTLPDGRSRESRLYFNDAGYAFTFGINHPCSGGWAYSKWTPWVLAALEIGRRFQNREIG